MNYDKEGKELYLPALVVGLLSIPIGLVIALAGEILAVVGIALSIQRKKEYHTKLSLGLSIVGLVISFVNHILGIIIVSQWML